MCYRLFAVLTVCAAGFFTTPDHVLAADDDIVGPAADETLIYVIRLKRRTAGLLGDWIAINDQTVARVKHKKHAVIRTKAGAITLSLAMQGFVDGAIALDDRPGETVYLRFRVGDWLLTEVDAAEATNLLKKSKLMDPIEEVLPNKERVAALLNISRIAEVV